MTEPQRGIIVDNMALKPNMNMVKQSMQKKALVAKTTKPQLSQKDLYSKTMNSAMKKGGSNGIGVGP